MALILRQVDKAKWLREEFPWLKPNELRGEVLKSFNTESCALSVYVVQDPALINRVVASMAAGRDRIQTFDYMTIDEKQLVDAGFVLKPSLGRTPDLEVASWHRDLLYLTVNRVVELLSLLTNAARNGIPERVMPAELKSLIRKGIDAKMLDTNQMKTTLLSEV